MAWWKPWTWFDGEKPGNGKGPENNKGLPGAIVELRTQLEELRDTVSVDSQELRDMFDELAERVKKLEDAATPDEPVSTASRKRKK